jgi:hypothetical protein
LLAEPAVFFIDSDTREVLRQFSIPEEQSGDIEGSNLSRFLVLWHHPNPNVCSSNRDTPAVPVASQR